MRHRGPNLTRGLVDRIAKMAARGYPDSAIARAIGIQPDTLDVWLRRGRDEARGVYGALARAWDAAQAAAETELVEEWRLHTGRDWRAAQTFLERRWPERWGVRQETKVTGKLEADVESVNAVLASLGWAAVGEAPDADGDAASAP